MFPWISRPKLEADIDALRLVVAQAATGQPVQIVSVIGQTRRCGTSTIAMGLARSFAASRRQVVLVDAHRRAPRLHRMSRVKRSPGALEAMDRVVPAREALKPLEPLSILLLPLGKPRERGATYATVDWRELLTGLGEGGAVVILDAGRVQDAAAVSAAAAADGTVLVVEAGRSPWQSVAHAVERIRRGGGNVLGLTVNKRRYPIPSLLYGRA